MDARSSSLRWVVYVKGLIAVTISTAVNMAIEMGKSSDAGE